MAANRSKLLGDGLAHGLGGGAALVATPTPRRGEHAFDQSGVCSCGCKRKLAVGAYFYLWPGFGWSQRAPKCSRVAT